MLRLLILLYLWIALQACDQPKSHKEEISSGNLAEELKEPGEPKELAGDENNVGQVFRMFKKYFATKQGDSAARYVDSTTKDFFNQAIVFAMTADSLRLCNERLMMRFYVLYIRHEIDQKDIHTLTTEKIIARVLDKRIIINEDLGREDLTLIALGGDEERVCGELKNSINKICFNHSKDGWGINLTGFFERQEESIRATARYRNIDNNASLVYVLADITNFAKIQNPLWKKLRRF
jgi:hypothetical protein